MALNTKQYKEIYYIIINDEYEYGYEYGCKI